MSQKLSTLFLLLVALGCSTLAPQQGSFEASSVDKKLKLQVWEKNGQLFYTLKKGAVLVIDTSELGVVTKGQFFDQVSNLTQVSKNTLNERYTLLHGKTKNIEYTSTAILFEAKTKSGASLGIEFRLSETGFAYRYILKKTDPVSVEIIGEKSSYHFGAQALGWLQPMSVSKSGWESTNPSYEEPYLSEVPLSTASPSGQGWVYPALIKNGDTWILLSETNLHRNYCGSRLLKGAKQELIVTYPQEKEVWPGQELYPVFKNELITPWRIAAIGSLADVYNSTLGTDLAAPAITSNTTYIRPGSSSWSWIMKKDDSVNFAESKNYIDYAARMNWPYCLIDVNWDRQIGDEKMRELSTYAQQKGVKLWLWYNSSGDWNTTKYTPKSKLLTLADREREFKKMKEWGIAGLKIDFFGGDGVSMIAYYHDILEQAAKHELLINFHGATLPRGWQRTYPNLLTMESIKGEEFVTFSQGVADDQARHCAIIPFTRNVFDPMDFTPMILERIPGIQRKTLKGFELALPFLFLSGAQHVAESPEGMEKQNPAVIQLLKGLPTAWEESRFLGGYPGKYILVARRFGDVWYVMGINAGAEPLNVDVDLSFVKKELSLLTDDGKGNLEVKGINTGRNALTLLANGGFVATTKALNP